MIHGSDSIKACEDLLTSHAKLLRSKVYFLTVSIEPAAHLELQNMKEMINVWKLRFCGHSVHGSRE